MVASGLNILGCALKKGAKSPRREGTNEMADVTEAGIYKEWWANPAVVGLMGFGTTTMATGLHNVGYWNAGPTLALAIAFGARRNSLRE